MSKKYTPNAAFGIIRGGPIPNPGRHVPPAEREENPKEILGIFVNPDESRPKKRARNSMKKKRKRKSTSTKRRKTTSSRKRRSTKRKTTAKRRRNAAPAKKRKSRRKKMTAAQARAKLRRLANPRAALTGRGGRSGRSRRSSYGAGELRSGMLLDAAQRDALLDMEIQSLEQEVAETRDPVAVQELAALIAQRDRLSSGMGLLDSVILQGNAPAVQELRSSLFGVAGKRKRQAAKRAARSKTRKGSKQKREDFFAAKAIKLAAELAGIPWSQLPKSKIPFLRKKFDSFSSVSGAPQGRRDLSFDQINVVTRGQGKAKVLEQLLLLPPSALNKAMRALSRNYIAASTDAGAEQAASVAMVQDALADAMGGGRLENPRRRKRRKSSKRRKSARGRRKGRSRRKKRRGRKRRKNPAGIIGGLLQTAAGSAVGYISVSIPDQIARMAGLDKSVLNVGGANSTIGAILYEAITTGSTIAAIVGLGRQNMAPGVRSMVNENMGSLITGAAVRGIRSVIDRTVKAKSPKDMSALVRQAFALPATVSGHGMWSPQMEGYYNFQPVMNGMLSPGYGTMAGWDAGYGTMAGYQNFAPTMDGYQNFAPTMSGYQNFAPTMAGYQNFAPTMGKGENPF